MPRNSDLEKQVFQSLADLRAEYDANEMRRKNIQDRMLNCINSLDWQGNKELINEICLSLPVSPLKLRMYEQLFELREAENRKSETNSPYGEV